MRCNIGALATSEDKAKLISFEGMIEVLFVY